MSTAQIRHEQEEAPGEREYIERHSALTRPSRSHHLPVWGSRALRTDLWQVNTNLLLTSLFLVGVSSLLGKDDFYALRKLAA